MKHLKWILPILIIAFCFLGFLIAPHNPEAMDIVNKYAAPSVDFPLGTDQFGRCELSRLLYGGKVTLGIVLLGGSIVLVLGTLIGLWLGRANAAKSLAFSSLLDAVTAIPPLAYLIIFVGIWGNSIPTMLVALTVSLILRMIKLVKTQTELELDKAYVLCAVSSGASRSRVLFVHILPNIIRPLVHFLCLSCAEMMAYPRRLGYLHLCQTGTGADGVFRLPPDLNGGKARHRCRHRGRHPLRNHHLPCGWPVP